MIIEESHKHRNPTFYSTFDFLVDWRIFCRSLQHRPSTRGSSKANPWWLLVHHFYRPDAPPVTKPKV